MTAKSYLFHDILKAPGYISQFDVLRLRKLANEATEEDFRENFSCDPEEAKRILFFWEIAQIELWDAEILKEFFHVWIYENREFVARRIQAAQINGRLPERFTPEVGLRWLESENVAMGMIPQWIKFNARRRVGGIFDTAGAGVHDVLALANKADAALPAPETKEQRQDRRLQACIDAGLVMPASYLSRLPAGVGDVADREGVTRQAFSTDVKAALERRESARKEGATVRRA